MKLFENENYDKYILPFNQFKLFCDINAQYPPKDKEVVAKAIADADQALNEEIPHLYAHTYPRFTRDGNRAEYETNFFKRRDVLNMLVWGEICSDSGKYMERILDIVWMIMEESCWFVPAHNRVSHDIGRNFNPLPVEYDNDFGYIDLFSAETAAYLAVVYHFLGDKFDEDIRDIVKGKIQFSVKKRIIEPFIKWDDMFWMGMKGNEVGNWCVWITSNVLLATALTEESLRTRQLVVSKALKCLDNFLSWYKNDGGCTEGPMYWSHAGQSYFDALEVLFDMSGGKINKFDNELVSNIFDYIRKVNVIGPHFLTFADCHPTALTEFKSVYRMGKKTDNQLLASFAKGEIDNKFEIIENRAFGMIRKIKDGVYPILEEEKYTPNYVEYLPDLQVATMRCQRKNDALFTVGIKGGNNAEAHNHNDVGNVVVYKDGKPLIIDIGICTYTKDLFNDNRYTVFPTYGKAHNLPIINGKSQMNGKEYCADGFIVDESAKMVTVSYKDAYENKNEIKMCKRTAKVDVDSVTITENIELNSIGACQFVYYLIDKPTVNNDQLHFENGAVVKAENCKITVEDVKLEDERLISDWGKDMLYKMTFTPKESDKFVFELKITAE